MKQVINGLTYNTMTADFICDLGSDGNTSRRDFQWWAATLYRTKKGRYFMAGEGGARSPFSQPYGQNGSQGGSGIRALSTEEALAYAERETDADTIAQFFKVEEA